jgi:hypothetical protein
MTIRPAGIDELILKIHSAPLQPDGWNAVATDLIGLFHADSAALLRISSDPTLTPWVLPIGFDPAALESYASHWAARDLWHDGARRNDRIGSGIVSVDDQLVERHTLS